MPTIIELSKQAQDQMLEAVQQTQKATVQAVEIWAKSVEPFAASVPPVPAVPFAGSLPAPEELVANWFGFTQKLVDAQSAYWQSVLAAAEPAFPKVEKSASQKSASQRAPDARFRQSAPGRIRPPGAAASS